MARDGARGLRPAEPAGKRPGRRYADALSVLLDAPEVDGVLVLNCPTAIASGRKPSFELATAALFLRGFRASTNPSRPCGFAIRRGHREILKALTALNGALWPQLGKPGTVRTAPSSQR